MKIRIVFISILSLVLFSCKDSERTAAPIVEQNENTAEVKKQLPYQVFTADGKLIGTIQSVKDSLNKIVLSKSRTLTKDENDFICNCFIKELRASNDADSLLTKSLHKCSELLRIQRDKETPNFFIYSKDGSLIGNKKTMKADILKEMKAKKVNIPDEYLNRIVSCIAEKYRNMTDKEIDNQRDIFNQCMLEKF